MIAIIDYGAGNLQSVVKAFEFIGCQVSIVDDPEMLERAEAAVLPGVGSFGDAMDCLKKLGFVNPIPVKFCILFFKSKKRRVFHVKHAALRVHSSRMRRNS